MRYFLDCEFYERPSQIDLISIAVVCEDGREYYTGVMHDFESAKRGAPWLIKNVYPYLPPPEEWKFGRLVARELHSFLTYDDSDPRHEIRPASEPEIWGFYSDFDWVVFCWLWGTMLELPSSFPKFCRDLKQLADQLQVPAEDYPPLTGTEHNALVDARWNREFYDFLTHLERRV